MKVKAAFLLLVILVTTISADTAVMVIDNFKVFRTRADGENLVLMGAMNRDDYAHIICVMGPDGKLIGRWESHKYHGWNDAFYEADTLYAYGSRFDDVYLQAWKGNETLFSKKLEGVDLMTWKSRIFPLGDKIILLSKVEENPKMDTEEHLYVAAFNKKDGKEIWSEELSGLEHLLWSGPDGKGHIRFLAGAQKGPEEEGDNVTVSIVLCRAKDKVDRKEPVVLEVKPDENNSPAALAEYVKMDDQFVAATFPEWGWKDSKKVTILKLDYGTGKIDAKEIPWDFPQGPRAWFAGYKHLYVFNSWYADDKQHKRIPELNLEGKTVKVHDPLAIFRDAMAEDGWKPSGKTAVEKPDAGLERSPHISDISIVRVGDKDLFICPAGDWNTATEVLNFITIIITDWK